MKDASGTGRIRTARFSRSYRVSAAKRKPETGSRKDASAMAAYADAPEPHNLLGIYYEQEGDLQSARKHYRAAYALDPTYKPCCRNLERITCFDFSTKITDADFGDGAEQTEDPLKRKIDISR